jgi:hypothetical protein
MLNTLRRFAKESNCKTIESYGRKGWGKVFKNDGYKIKFILDHINVYRKIKGKVRWNDMTLGLYDPVTPSGAQAVMEWARLAHESVTGRDGYSDFYKKDLTLDILGPVGDIVGEWIVKGAYVKTATFGEYDWANEAAVNLSVTIAMDYCVLNF